MSKPPYDPRHHTQDGWRPIIEKGFQPVYEPPTKPGAGHQPTTGTGAPVPPKGDDGVRPPPQQPVKKDD